MEKKMIKALVVGFGNIGRYAIESLNTETDFQLVGIVDPFIAQLPRDMENVPLAKSLQEAPEFDVALLCVPSRKVKETGLQVLAMIRLLFPPPAGIPASTRLSAR